MPLPSEEFVRELPVNSDILKKIYQRVAGGLGYICDWVAPLTFEDATFLQYL
jgi:hypothetical protein